MFSYNGETSATIVSLETFTMYAISSTETVYNLEEGVPFYLFQWHLKCLGVDGAYVDSYTNMYYTHSSVHPPPDPAHMAEDMRKNLVIP